MHGGYFVKLLFSTFWLVRLTEGNHGNLLFWKERQWQILSSEGWLLQVKSLVGYYSA